MVAHSCFEDVSAHIKCLSNNYNIVPVAFIEIDHHGKLILLGCCGNIYFCMVIQGMDDNVF